LSSLLFNLFLENLLQASSII